MSILLDHLIVPSHAPVSSAQSVADILGVRWEAERGHFTPVYVPIVRGILDVCHAFAARDVSRADVLELYRDFYRDEPFVRVCDTPDLEGDAWRHRAYPWVSAVAVTSAISVNRSSRSESQTSPMCPIRKVSRFQSP